MIVCLLLPTILHPINEEWINKTAPVLVHMTATYLCDKQVRVPIQLILFFLSCMEGEARMVAVRLFLYPI